MIWIEYAYAKAADSQRPDENEEEAPVQMLIIVAKDARTGTYSASGWDAEGHRMYPVKWLCCLGRRLGYRRLILQSDGEPSICALKNAAVLAVEGVEVMSRESPVGEHTESPCERWARSSGRSAPCATPWRSTCGSCRTAIIC